MKTKSFVIGAPEKFKNLVINDKNVIDIISCIDSNGNEWYEVDFLAQENVAIENHYTSDETRNDSSETSVDGTSIVPSSLSFIRTTKRFITEVNEDNTTSLIFGNGIVKNGKRFETTFLELEQEGVKLPTTNFSPKLFANFNNCICPVCNMSKTPFVNIILSCFLVFMF